MKDETKSDSLHLMENLATNACFLSQSGNTDDSVKNFL